MTDQQKKIYTVTFTTADVEAPQTVAILAYDYVSVDKHVRDSREGDVTIVSASYKYPIDITNQAVQAEVEKVPQEFYAEVRTHTDGMLEGIADEYQDVLNDSGPWSAQGIYAQKILDIVDTEFGYRIAVADAELQRAEERAGA